MKCKCPKIFQAFDTQEQAEILEIARLALRDGETFDMCAEELGLTDKAMQELCNKINKASEL